MRLSLAFILLAIVLFANTGLVLDSDHAIIVSDFQVPKHPEWTQPGVVIDGSKLGFAISSEDMVLVKGLSWKNPLPPWEGHAKIRVVIAHPCSSGWCEEKDLFGADKVKTEVEVEPGTYTIKAWIEQGALKIAYKGGFLKDYKLLYSQVLDSKLLQVEVWSEKCTPKLEKIVGGSSNYPIPITSSDLLIPMLIGGGLLAVGILTVTITKKGGRNAA